MTSPAWTIVNDNLEYDELNNIQRLKAAVHYTVLRICREIEKDLHVTVDKQVVAALTEMTWKQCKTFTLDLELFAKHAKRTTVNADDVKMLVRKAPNLLKHICRLHDSKLEKQEPKKKVKKNKTNNTRASVDVTVDSDED